jgi:hypothetical protein
VDTRYIYIEGYAINHACMVCEWEIHSSLWFCHTACKTKALWFLHKKSTASASVLLASKGRRQVQIHQICCRSRKQSQTKSEPLYPSPFFIWKQLHLSLSIYHKICKNSTTTCIYDPDCSLSTVKIIIGWNNKWKYM